MDEGEARVETLVALCARPLVKVPPRFQAVGARRRLQHADERHRREDADLMIPVLLLVRVTPQLTSSVHTGFMELRPTSAATNPQWGR